MKIFKIVLTGALILSGYLGYSNFINIDVKEIHEVLAPMSMEEAADAARDRVRGEKEESDDMVWKIIETVAPLLAPILAGYKRKNKEREIRTLDEDIADIAIHLGCSKAVIKGKLGLGDRRKKQNTTNHRRRTSDRKS
jgi:hypothetical protein